MLYQCLGVRAKVLQARGVCHAAGSVARQSAQPCREAGPVNSVGRRGCAPPVSAAALRLYSLLLGCGFPFSPARHALGRTREQGSLVYCGNIGNVVYWLHQIHRVMSMLLFCNFAGILFRHCFRCLLCH